MPKDNVSTSIGVELDSLNPGFVFLVVKHGESVVLREPLTPSAAHNLGVSMKLFAEHAFSDKDVFNTGGPDA